MTLINKILAEKKRLIQFASVGLSGVFVNLAFVWLGNSLFFNALEEPFRTWASMALAILISIFFNYVLNFLWTWKDRRGMACASFLEHLLKFYLASLAAAGVQFFIANGIIFLFKVILFSLANPMPVLCKLCASVFGIAVAGIFNFIANHFWTFKVQTVKEKN